MCISFSSAVASVCNSSFNTTNSVFYPHIVFAPFDSCRPFIRFCLVNCTINSEVSRGRHSVVGLSNGNPFFSVTYAAISYIRIM